MAGLLLALAGVALPFLMVVGTIEPSFLLSAVSLVASLGGITMGSVGASQIAGIRRAVNRGR
jgi:hypothetical protein